MPPELLEWVKSGGAITAPIFMYLWWYEREERKLHQGKNEELAERTITAMVEFKQLLQTVVDIFNGRKV